MARGTGNSIEPKVDKLVAFCKLNVALDALLWSVSQKKRQQNLGKNLHQNSFILFQFEVV